MHRNSRDAFGVLTAALMVGAVILQSLALGLLPARSSAFGGQAGAGLQQFDHYAVLPHKAGQSSDSRDRWEPAPDAPWLREAARLRPVGRRVAVPARAPLSLSPAVCRSRMCLWLI